MEALKPTAGAEWRQFRQSAVVALPSGRIAEVRSVSFYLLMRLGRIPDHLTGMIVDHVFGNAPLDIDLKDAKNLKAFLELLDALTECCLVNPRVVKEPVAEDEIAVEDVAEEDKMFLYKLLSRPASALATFREKQSGDVASVDGEPGHEAATE